MHANFNLDGVTNFNRGLATGSLSIDFLEPRVGKVAAEQEHAEQHVHRIHQQTEFEKQTDQQQRERAENPFHSVYSNAGMGGTGTLSRISLIASATLRLRRRLSGRRIS